MVAPTAISFAAVQAHRASYAEYLEVSDELRAEYVHGEIFSNPPPSVSHQQICQRLLFALARVVPADRLVLAAGWLVSAEPPHVRIPDLAVMAGPEAGNLITEAPLVVVEVLSTNRKDDLVRKSPEYLAAGLGQYWIVDPREYELGALTNTPTGWEPALELTRDAPTGSVAIAGLGTIALSLDEILGS